MKRPEPDDMRMAAQWLECYEEDAQGEQCRRVARWLDDQAGQAELRAMAKEAGVSVRFARKMLAKPRRSKA